VSTTEDVSLLLMQRWTGTSWEQFGEMLSTEEH
jgi:hypothetical protein